MIVDTNALSDYLKGESAIIEVLDGQEAVYVPVVVLGEYRFGLLGSASRQEGEIALATFVAGAAVLTIDDRTADYYAGIRMVLRLQGRPIPANDVWIAALARQHLLPILSQDAHFDLVDGLQRVGW